MKGRTKKGNEYIKGTYCATLSLPLCRQWLFLTVRIDFRRSLNWGMSTVTHFGKLGAKQKFAGSRGKRGEELFLLLLLACVVGVKRVGSGEAKFEREWRGEREARSLGSGREVPNLSPPCWDRSNFALEFNFPPPYPLYAGHSGYIIIFSPICQHFIFLR